MCGQYLHRILTSFSIVQEDTLHDGEIHTIYTSFVKGLASTTRTIIALSDSGKVWCAGMGLENSKFWDAKQNNHFHSLTAKASSLLEIA